MMKHIALIVRGKHFEDHNPGLLEQHADVVLSTGMPIGFFGTGGGFLARSGLSMNGVVANYEIMKQIRPSYIDADKAIEKKVKSTLCLLRVSSEKARSFDQFWLNPSPSTQKKMRSFSILGDNCSTAASLAFQHAGILNREIPMLDTPNNLYHQLKTKYGSNFSCSSGYVGFRRNGNRFEIIVKK